ncbi:hypothetical protein [Methylotenera mobilis]|jgi:hypothetical protein|uniref:hypothetical protein n=1 Tax=Methylotenera mobilis TaxID=359408 RepID=UPI0012FA88E6|nr:hypothetical protein [Methylotenera mobilis]
MEIRLKTTEREPAARSSTLRIFIMINICKLHAFSLATTLGVAYILCAIYDTLFPPYGLLAALASASPWPIYGSPIGFLTGFLMFIAAGFVLGAFYGIAWGFWSKKL